MKQDWIHFSCCHDMRSNGITTRGRIICFSVANLANHATTVYTKQRRRIDEMNVVRVVLVRELRLTAMYLLGSWGAFTLREVTAVLH
jgi:hypothetical protein